MLEFIQNIFLGELFIFIVLFALFALLTRWAVIHLREYTGYALGWMVGVFFMIIYGSLVGSADTAAQVAENGGDELTFLQVIGPSIIGLGLGAGAILLIRMNPGSRASQSLKVAFLTALSVIVLFFMVISGFEARRMIGIFALAFGIGLLFTNVLYHPSGRPPARAAAVSSDIDDVPSGGNSRLDRIRSQMRERDRR